MTTRRTWRRRIAAATGVLAVSIAAFLLVAWIAINAMLNSPNFRLG